MTFRRFFTESADWQSFAGARRSMHLGKKRQKWTLIGDDSKAVRTLCLNLQPIYHLTQRASIPAILRALRSTTGWVLLLGRVIPRNTFEELLAARSLQERNLIFFVVDEQNFSSELLDFAQAGLVETTTTAEEFTEILVQSRKRRFVAPSWFQWQMTGAANSNDEAFGSETVQTAQLTAMEIRVLGLISKHFENKEIAGELSLSLSMTQKLVLSAYSKLGVRRRTEAAVIWSRLQR